LHQDLGCARYAAVLVPPLVVTEPLMMVLRQAVRLSPPLWRPQTACRMLSSSASAQETVKLAYDKYQPPTSKQSSSHSQAIVLSHGLFGSKQNWRSIAKALAQKVGLPVYALDLRNHGTSPHIDSLRYDEMAQDLMQFFKDHNIRQATLVGHSMGGKAVQSMALSKDLPSDYLSGLISVDMSPARGPLSTEFAQYIEAMIEIEDANCTSRQEADEILKKTEPELDESASPRFC
jgi:pimeloyl-ACP methyl ester carboxylesterase